MSFKFNFDLEEDDLDTPETSHIPQAGLENASAASGSGPSAAAAPDSSVSAETSGAETKSVWDEKSYTVSLDELLDTLPSRILYSPLPLSFPLPHPLLRRDLHDARFQLASTSLLGAELASSSTSGHGDATTGNGSSRQETGKSEGEQKEKEKDEGEAYVSAGTGTDLIPGLYEGGLKTWEGGVDLVQVLAGREGDLGGWVRGRGVLEVGCGTALPSAYILSRLLASPSPSPLASITVAKPTKLLLQDYNLPVLTLVSLPNLLLASLPYLPLTMLEPEPSTSSRSEPNPIPSIPEGDEYEAADIDANGETETGTRLAEVDAPSDFSTPGELEITPDLKSAFKRLLEEKGVELEFRYGGWKGLGEAVRKEKEGYGLVLSAETIYAEGSVGDLIGVLRGATVRKGAEDEKDGKSGEEGEGGDVAGKPEEGLDMGKLSVKDDLEWDRVDLQNGGSLVLIAAKILYFGVGGGLQDFLGLVEREKGWWAGVKDWTAGVGRRVVRVGW